jgi:phage-related tail protein
MAIYLPILTSFNPKGLKEAEKGFKDLEGAQAKAKYALGKANKYAAVALGGLVAGLGDAVKGAMEDEQAQKMLARQLEKTTNATDAQIKGVEDYITAAGKQKGFTDDELRPSMAGLVRATMDIGEAQKATNLAMDVAAAKGISLETVTKAMEKAYGGNMTALAKLSPELRQMIKDGASMDEIMAEMAVTFCGAATDSANTAAGSMKRLGIALGEAKEGVGAALLPILEKAMPVLQSFATWAQDNPTLITAVAVAFGALAAAVVLVNAAMALNPAVLITAGIIALGVALVMAYKRFDTFRAVVQSVANGVAGYFEFIANAYIKMINLVIRGINLIKPGKDIGQIGQVSFGRLGGEDGGNGGANPAGLDYKAMATGGIVTSPTFALIGEAGPEAVIPLSKMGSMGGGITVNVNGGDPQAVVDALRRYQRQNGFVPITVGV